MLSSKSGRRPAIRFLRACAVALLLLALPGLATAASTTLTLTDSEPSGLGVSILLDDMADPGNLSVTITLTTTGDATGDLRFFLFETENDNLYPALSAAGPDVFGSRFFTAETLNESDPCRCYLNVDLGGEGELDPTGLQTTSFVISHPSVDLTLASLAGETVYVHIGRDELPSDARLYGDRPPPTFVKLDGDIPVIPEPTTAMLMLIGLGGLSLTSRRLER